MGVLRVGTSGWAYAAWRGPFYPAGLAPRDFLGYYAARFETVEVNHTFYRMPAAATLAAWGAAVPPGFQFALKVPQRISHERRLRDCRDVLQHFLAAAAALKARGQLGPLLLQLPPAFPADLLALAGFLSWLPAGVRLALEVRHPSWATDAADALLRAHGAAWCLAETDQAPAREVLTAGFVYVRLRRSVYGAGELEAWRARCAGWLSRGLDVYLYVKHDEAGRAPAVAAALLGAEPEPDRPSA